MQVNYHNHSCFTVETPKLKLIFDCGIKPEHKRLKDDIIAEARRYKETVPRLNKQLALVFSHRHLDHFDLDLAETMLKLEVPVILADEVDLSDLEIFNAKNFYRLLPRTQTSIELNEQLSLEIICSGSTDQGGALLMCFDEAHIFFAGDLAVWDWDQHFAHDFASELAYLTKQRNQREIDVAFIPCCTADGWQERPLLAGQEELCRSLKPRIVIPMHAWRFEHFWYGFARYIEQKLPVKIKRWPRQKALNIKETLEKQELMEVVIPNVYEENK